MLSKSSKWVLGFVQYIARFTISRFISQKNKIMSYYIFSFISTGGKNFQLRNVLNCHVMSVHSDRRDFKCDRDNCTKSFKLKTNLAVHIKMVHENIRDKICDSCGKGFSTSNNLKKHVRTVHEGIRDTCPICSKSLSGRVQDHIDTVHKGLANYCCDM